VFYTFEPALTIGVKEVSRDVAAGLGERKEEF